MATAYANLSLRRNELDGVNGAFSRKDDFVITFQFEAEIKKR